MSFCEHENGEQSFLQSKHSEKISRLPIEENFNTSNSSISICISPPSSPHPNLAQENDLPDIIGWRRAITEDIPAVKKLQSLTGDIANSLFMENEIDELFDRCLFSTVQYDSNGDVISFTACDSYPNIPSLPIFWEDWLSINYRFDGVDPRNVLFIHYMLWQPEQADKFLPLLLESMFSEFVHLKYIIVIKPPNVVIPDFYRNYFIPVLPPDLKELEYDSIQIILVCLKTSIIHPLCIRSAFGYELEFIMSAFKGHIKATSNTETSYVLDFVNFLYQKDQKTLVCEFDGQLVGIMILNLKIDLDLLNKRFELAPFNGLRKKNLLEQNSESDSSVSWDSSFNIQESPNLLISSEFLFSQMNWEIMLGKLKKTDSSFCMNDSASSDPSEDESSEFSFVTLSSLTEEIHLDKKKTESDNNVILGKNEFLPKAGNIKVGLRTPGIAMTHFYPPKYHGQSNAFVIDFFAIDCAKVDEKLSSFDFLEAAFKKVPDRDYCVLIIPTDILPFPLMDLFVVIESLLSIIRSYSSFLRWTDPNFSQTKNVANWELLRHRVTPKHLSTFKQELYLCHKNSLSVISMCVRSTEKDDLTDIKYFLRHLDEGGTVYQDILNNCFVTNKDFKSFVLTVEKEIVGVSLINCQNSVKHFQMYFNIAEITSTDNSSIVKHLIINPDYQNHARFFLRDIMRLTDVSSLYYVHKNKSSKVDCNVVTVLREFFPVKPKRKAGLDELFSLGHVPFSEEIKAGNSFGLYFINPSLCGITRLHRNIVIVVVGVSRTSLAFLESLIFGEASNFTSYNNLICVTPHALETKCDPQDLKFMFPIRDNFSREYLSLLSLESYVHFIYGAMTGINRSEKYIIVNNKDLVKYDYLILTCGLQYWSPQVKAKEAFKNNCPKNLRSSLARFLIHSQEQKKINVPKHPNNMFIINTNYDAKYAIQSLQYLLNNVKGVRQAEKKIIIYGHDLHVFLTIHTLLKLGIPGDFIVFVEPFPRNTTTVTLFNDYCVDQAVLETVKECKVSCYMEYFLYDWSVSSDDFITSITFHSQRKEIVIPCLAFFPFLEKLVSEVTFNACNDAGLVYDGRLVINNNFRTNDSCIYSAGPFTKYAKRYFASERNHQYYNSTEVGQKLAEIIREEINPLKEKKLEEESDLVPHLTTPIFLYCQLPGDFNLFVLRKPGKELDLETAYNFINYGEVLTTGDCKMKKGYGYFRLHLDPGGFVQSITCYTKDKIDYVNLSSLYGLHEKLLNNLLIRYDMATIPDFFDYFRQPWAFALYHENFQLLRYYNNQSFRRNVFRKKNFSDKIIEKLQLNGWKALPESAVRELEKDYFFTILEDDIKNNLLQFLEHNKEDLPMYAIPSEAKKLNYKCAEP